MLRTPHGRRMSPWTRARRSSSGTRPLGSLRATRRRIHAGIRRFTTPPMGISTICAVAPGYALSMNKTFASLFPPISASTFSIVKSCSRYRSVAPCATCATIGLCMMTRVRTSPRSIPCIASSRLSIGRGRTSMHPISVSAITVATSISPPSSMSRIRMARSWMAASTRFPRQSTIG